MNRDKTIEHRDRQPGRNRDTSRAQENPPKGGLCPVVPVCPPGRDTTQAGQGQKVSEIAGGSGLTPALNNRQENFA